MGGGQNKAALFANNKCVNSHTLTERRAIACLYLFNMFLGFKWSSWFSQWPLVADANVMTRCFLACSASPSPRWENKYQSVNSTAGYMAWALQEISLAPALTRQSFLSQCQILQPCWHAELLCVHYSWWNMKEVFSLEWGFRMHEGVFNPSWHLGASQLTNEAASSAWSNLAFTSIRTDSRGRWIQHMAKQRRLVWFS